VSSFTTIVCLAFGSTNIPIADASTVFFSSPVWSPFLAKIFLKAPFKILHFVAIALSVGGVVFVSQPNFIFHSSSQDEGQVPRGSLMYMFVIGVCLCGALCAAATYVVIHKSSGKVSHYRMTFSYAVCGGRNAFSFFYERMFVTIVLMVIFFVELFAPQ
jgi:drug/metabolite transporter (DMT)-like permease